MTLALAGAGAAIPSVKNVMAQAGDYELVCNADGVRLRTDPGLSSTVIGSVNAGDVVSVTGETIFAEGYGWMPVFVHRTGQNGYVADEFFERPDGGTGFFRGTPVHVTSDNVNLRAGAGTNFKILANFSTDTNAVVNDGPVSGSGYTWYNIMVGGTTGWMAADFLAEGHVNDGTAGEWAPGSYVMTSTALNLRSGAGLGHSVVKVSPVGEAATVLTGPTSADGYAWYQVELWDAAATIGWFAGEYLEAARFEPTGARHRVFDGPLNLRSGASLDASVVTALPTGTIVVISQATFASADGYTWMPVYVEDNPRLVGWIAQGFSEEI